MCADRDGARERKVHGYFSFNDALNTFYTQLYGVGHMVKDYSYSESGNPLSPLHGLHRISHSLAIAIPVIEHGLERHMAEWVHHEGSIR